jgi:hypothetical protein
MNKSKNIKDGHDAAAEPFAEETPVGTPEEITEKASTPVVGLTGMTASIYISDIGIKFLSAGKQGVNGWKAVALPPGLVNSGQITNPPAVAEILANLVKENSIKPERTIVGMSGLHGISRVFTLPRAAKKVLGEAIRHEAERELPVNLNNAYLYWHPVRSTGENMEVFVIAYEKNTIDTMLKTLQLAGLNSCILEFIPIALMRVADQDAGTIFNLRPGELDIVELEENFPKIIRSLPLSADKPVNEYITVIKKELERTIQYFLPDHETGNEKVIQGSGIYNNGHDVYNDLSIQLGRQVKPLTPALDYPEDFPAADYTVNIGLVLRASARGKSLKAVNIDLQPPKPKKSYGALKYAVLITAIAAISFFGTSTLQRYQQETAEINAQLSVNTELLASRVAKQQVITNLITQITRVSSQTVNLNAIQERMAAGNQQLITDMENAVSLLPAGVSFSSIRYDNGLVIDGTANDQETALDYGQALMGTGSYSGLVIANMQQENYAHGYSFHFIFTR